MRAIKRSVVAAAVALAASSAAMSPAQASADDTEVSIVGFVDFVQGVGTFEAEGGGLCASGTTSEPDGTQTVRHGRTLTFLLDKTFTCADGSGTFTLRLRAWYRPCEPANRGVWKVVDGTGDYVDLRGSGQLVGTYFPGPCDDAEGVQDAYTGHVFHG